jgi:hypothetical protein
MPSSSMLRRVALVKNEISEELSVSIMRVTRIHLLGKTLAVTSVPILVTRRLRRYVLPKRRFFQDSYGVIYQKMAFFIVTAVNTSNLRLLSDF